ncbi:unnamed protein product [Leptidea sinapis]|uniref:Uncharacterized protein n=1 Tax=Leptidea sinapis TaxID=189913 RepID=A0A5E4QAX3_9NEOP|nr:unnamed protein product [Leptidea sinapis]
MFSLRRGWCFEGCTSRRSGCRDPRSARRLPTTLRCADSRGAALEVLRALVNEGHTSVDVRDADGRTPLLWAASAGSAAAVLALNQAGAKVDDADRDGLTALHCAAARGHTEALETLVGLCGAKVDVADTHGCTPLHYAAALGHADATSALLEHGADSHRQDRRGRSPAHTAAAKGQIETVRILGARGANLWLRNSKGDLPLHEAVASGRRELVKWLLDGRPSQVNATNHEGRTPMHVAAATDNADLCRLLLDRGAEVNSIARSSRNEPLTPLDCAIIRGHRSTAKYLQMHGGVPSSKLANTEIVFDSAPISGLAKRRVTSTKIDLQDKIKIEKCEIVELSSPGKVKHSKRFESDATSDSCSHDEIRNRKKCKQRKSSRTRFNRKKDLADFRQKSFSDGYDTDVEGNRKEIPNRVISKSHKQKKSRSRSEPSRRSRSSPRRRHRYRSSSESSSDISSYTEKKINKRHKKRSKRRIYATSQSSSESSERRSTKYKGKKTSIHIENDDLKQSINIVKYKNTDTTQSGKMDENVLNHKLSQASNSVDTEVIDTQNVKDKTLSETETDTVSVKTNMVTTEAQIHMEKENSQHGSSELIVTVDSQNNVSIEASNMNVLQMTENDKSKSDTEQIHNDNKEAESANNTEKETTNNSKENVDECVNEEFTNNAPPAVHIDDSQKETNDIEVIQTENKLKPDPDNLTENINPSELRKRSFQVISGPKEINKESLEHTSSLEKSSPTVSFSNKHEVIKIKDLNMSSQESEEKLENVTHEPVEENTSTHKISQDQSTARVETNQSKDKGLISILKDHVDSETCNKNISVDTNDTISPDLSPRIHKTSNDSQIGSRKSSIYETESYKVLSETADGHDSSGSILKQTNYEHDYNYDNSQDNKKIEDIERLPRQTSYGRIPSVSDNEIYYSQSEANGKRKRFRKKSRSSRSRIQVRSKSENSERGYESSGFMDSGFEPSPRTVQRCVSPRVNAYYQQRKSGRLASGNSKIPIRKPGDRNAVDMTSVTQRIQTNIRRKANEAVLVKRAIDEYNKSSLAQVGLGAYSSIDYSFSSFEKFLYESLRKLQKSGKRHLSNLPEKPIDFDYGESELYKMSSIPDNPCLCTSKTHRCFHAVHAYTGIPCSAYIPYKWNHHTMPKPATAGPQTKSKSFLPKINPTPSTSSGKAHVTLEVSHGSEKQLIAIPAEKLDKNKRYYVTFTVKGSEPPSDDNSSPIFPKTVRSG